MERKINTRRRVVIASIALLSCMFALTGRAVYLITSDSVRTQTNLLLMTRTPGSLIELAEQVRKIDKVARNIDDYRVKDIKDVLGETAKLAGRASLELKAQADAWDEIKAKSAVDASSYQEIRHNLDTVNSLQSQEIVKLRALLGKAEEASLLQNAWYLFTSFLLGVASSLAAAYAYDRIRGRKLLNDLAGDHLGDGST